MVFVIFLPPLLYLVGVEMLRGGNFGRNLVVIGLLAVGLVGFTVWGVAEFSDRFITATGLEGWISAGGSGFDDGCDCSYFDCQAGWAAAADRRHSGGRESAERCDGIAGARDWACDHRSRRDADVWGGIGAAGLPGGGGIGIGLLIGVAVAWMEKFIDDGPVELVVSLVVPYAAYLAGETGEGFGGAGGGGLRTLYEP